MMAAMHEDDSPDLREVARILKDILEVNKSDTISFVLKSRSSLTIIPYVWPCAVSDSRCSFEVKKSCGEGV